MMGCCWERRGKLHAARGLTVADTGRPFTRHILHFGRDDVTTFYTDLLRRVSFPYHELDLNRRLDWQMMDELTTRTCTLLDVSCSRAKYTWHVADTSVYRILWRSTCGKSRSGGKGRLRRNISCRRLTRRFLRPLYVWLLCQGLHALMPVLFASVSLILECLTGTPRWPR